MPKSRIPSPARSQGAAITPRRERLRRTRSVASPALSTASGRLTSVIEHFKEQNMESFALSPLNSRRSILTDDTDIEEPRRKSWWKKLNENSRDILEVLQENNVDGNAAIEELIDIEVLSQEKQNYTLDLPESSDSESINSIVLPQRKLFTQKENKAKKNYGQVINSRESLAKQKNITNYDQTLNAGTKELFAGSKRTKPVFPAGLLNITPNKTAVDKTKEAIVEPKPARNIFGNRPTNKRKNMFANFIVSDSEDDIPEIQPKVFGFQRKMIQGQGPVAQANITVEMDDWKHLPSSTMMEHQLEELMHTPIKKARLETDKSGKKKGNSSRSKINKSVLDDQTSKNVNVTKDVHTSTKQNQQDNTEKDNEQSLKSKKSVKMYKISIADAVDGAEDCDDHKNDQNSDNNMPEINNVVSEDEHSAASEGNAEIGNDYGSGNRDNEINNKEDINNKEIDEVQGVMNNTAISKKSRNKSTKNEDQENLNEDNYELRVLDITVDKKQNKANASQISNEEAIQNINDSKIVQEQESGTSEIIDGGDKKLVIENEAIVEESEEIEDVETENHVTDDKNETTKDESDIENEVVKDPVNKSLRDDANVSKINDEDGNQDEEDMYSKDEEVNSQEDDHEDDNADEIQDNDNEDTANEIEVEDDANKSEVEDEANESKVEDDANKSEVEDEANESEVEDDANKSELEDAANESEVEDDENERREVEDEDEANENAAVTDNSQDIEDGQDVSDDSDRAIASDNDPQDEQTEEMEVDDGDEDPEELRYESDKEEDNLEEDDQVEGTPDVTHDTTDRNRIKPVEKSPEAILRDKSNQVDSFTAHGRNTSVRKTLLKSLHIRPSMARESIGLSDGTKDSSAEGSGWDSHRTTRKTLRQTMGKDFTLRKSLRALVMEKSAKRQTEHTDVNSETVKYPQANSTELPDDMHCEVEETMEQSDHEISRNTRQTTLEMYLQKIKQQNIERKLKTKEAVLNSLKAPSRDTLNFFKVPTKPAPRCPKTNKPEKRGESMPLVNLPAEVIQDLKYKPPKRFRPSNASWITTRLYKFLETKLEPKYDYKARVRAEKLVETIYYYVKDLRRHDAASPDATDVLKHEVARLDIVKTHFEFYEFFNDYMPREVRIKVVPDIVNKIPLPRHGVFSDILRGNTVQG